MATPLFELEAVTKAFRRPDAGELEILSGLTLTLSPGERLTIVGPSGSGKSTLLAVLAGLELPTRGRVLWRGRALTEFSAAEEARRRNRELGFLFQAHHLLPQLSALENVLVPTLAKSAAGTSAGEARARELLARLGLTARLEHRPSALSGGERARVALARALVNGPSLLLADEPTGALDARTAEDLGDWFVRLNEEDGLALVVVTHSERLAARLGHVRELREGRLLGR